MVLVLTFILLPTLGLSLLNYVLLDLLALQLFTDESGVLDLEYVVILGHKALVYLLFYVYLKLQLAEFMTNMAFVVLGLDAVLVLVFGGYHMVLG